MFTTRIRRNHRLNLAAVAAVAVAVAAPVTIYTEAASASAASPSDPPAAAWSPKSPVPGGAKPTVVLVHGAWADGSSWKGEVRRLQAAGFTVDVPPVPLRGIASDAAYLNDYLSTITGPIVLVGHSYGGSVITNIASNPNVKALVYDDAFLPSQGETIMDEVGAKPGSLLAQPAPTVFNFAPFPGAASDVVDLYVKPAIFGQVFAANVAPAKIAELAATQSPLASSAVMEASGTPAWATIPSWDVIGLQDQLIPAAEQLSMAQRAHSHVVEINAPHLSLITDPTAVTNTIIAAADATS
jgi:pimeloyl-ACP methyl ester carboxylesterase